MFNTPPNIRKFYGQNAINPIRNISILIPKNSELLTGFKLNFVIVTHLDAEEIKHGAEAQCNTDKCQMAIIILVKRNTFMGTMISYM